MVPVEREKKIQRAVSRSAELRITRIWTERDPKVIWPPLFTVLGERAWREGRKKWNCSDVSPSGAKMPAGLLAKCETVGGGTALGMR